MDRELGLRNGPVVIGPCAMDGIPPLTTLCWFGCGVGGGEVPPSFRSLRVMCGRDCASSVASTECNEQETGLSGLKTHRLQLPRRLSPPLHAVCVLRYPLSSAPVYVPVLACVLPLLSPSPLHMRSECSPTHSVLEVQQRQATPIVLMRAGRAEAGTRGLCQVA